MEVRPIFWSPADKCVSYFAKKNKSLQLISDFYPYYFMCSRGADSVIEDHYGRLSVIRKSKNNMTLKGKILFEELSIKDDYDVLIRLDMDAIVFDFSWLSKIAKRSVDTQRPIGNIRKKKTGEKYMRGACHFVPADVIRLVSLDKSKNPREFDLPFSRSIPKEHPVTGYKCFELNNGYRGTAPTWHPLKTKDKKKVFSSMVDLFAANYGESWIKT